MINESEIIPIIEDVLENVLRLRSRSSLFLTKIDLFNNSTIMLPNSGLLDDDTLKSFSDISHKDLNFIGSRMLYILRKYYYCTSISRPTQVELYRGVKYRFNHLSISKGEKKIKISHTDYLDENLKYIGTLNSQNISVFGMSELEKYGRESAEEVSDKTGMTNFQRVLLKGLQDRYTWRARLSLDGYMGATFYTDPIGCCDIFKLRDIPDGRKRRAALLNWIRNHWRKKRDGGLAEIKKHLRGANEFKFNGLRCKIFPSDFDAERSNREELKEMFGNIC